MRLTVRCRKGWPLVARLLFSEQFLDDAATTWPPRVKEHLHGVLHMIEQFPESGSSCQRASVTERFGPDVRTCAISPLDLVYRYDRESDTVYLHGLISQKMAR